MLAEGIDLQMWLSILLGIALFAMAVYSAWKNR